jgi:hypothetical protein
VNRINFENNYRFSHDYENQKDGFDYLADKITLPASSYNKRDYTPTPLDPDSVYVGSVPYPEAINRLLDERLDKVVPQQMPNHVVEFLKGVMARDNHHRVTRNAHAMSRLQHVYQDFSSLSPQHSDLITDLRAGTASTDDALKLISIIPELGSIEVMKFTSPFDEKGIVEANHITNSHLIKVCRELNFEIKMLDEFEHPLRRKDVVGTEEGVVIIIRKRPEMRISANGVKLELVRSQTEAVFKANEFGLPQNTINGLNVQPINISKYLRLAQTD